MKKRKSLKKSLGILCGTIAALCAVLYSATLFYVLHTAESKLMASTMDDMLTTVVTYDVLLGKPPRLDQASRLYIEGDRAHDIPAVFKNFPLGYTEFTDGEDLHTYSKVINGKRYLLTRHQGNFEVWERRLFLAGILGFLALIAVCFSLGYFLARRMISPLDTLTKEANQAEDLIKNGRIYSEEIFKEKWPNNEIGELGRTFKALVAKLKNLAIRERDFSSEVSHEIRTPLTVIDTSLEILEEQVRDNPRQKALIRRAMNASSRIKGMAEIFLNIGRSRSGQNTAQCTMPELINRLKESWKQKAKEKNLELVIKENGDSNALFNEVLAASVLDNLVFNSIHYTEKGSVTVEVLKDKVIVKDTGIGIKEEDREKIFNSGFRGDGQKHYQGFGLGLAISKRAAEALGWPVSLRSEIGKGSEFIVSLDGKN